MEDDFLQPAPRLTPASNETNNGGQPHFVNPLFSAPNDQNLPASERVSKCLPRGHLFGALFERESYFSFYSSGLLSIAFMLTIMICLLNYDPEAPGEYKLWRYIFYIKAAFQVCKMLNYALMRCCKVPCSNELIHFTILTCIHLFYSWCFTEKKPEVKYAGYFAFAYVIIINFIGVSNVNKTEATVSEIIFFAVLIKLSSDQNWAMESLDGQTEGSN